MTSTLRRLSRAEKQIRIKDRRAWYLYKLSVQLHRSCVPNIYTPRAEEDWSTDLWVGTTRAPTSALDEAELIRLTCRAEHDLDEYGSKWLATIALPPCCVSEDQSASIEADLDEIALDPDSAEEWLRGGVQLQPGMWMQICEVANQAAQAWWRHQDHQHLPPSPGMPDGPLDPYEPAAPVYGTTHGAATTDISPCSGTAWSPASGGLL